MSAEIKKNAGELVCEYLRPASTSDNDKARDAHLARTAQMVSDAIERSERQAGDDDFVGSSATSPVTSKEALVWLLAVLALSAFVSYLGTR